MYSEVLVQQKSGEEASQQASLSIYPQFCGCWPDNDWPEEVPGDWHSDLAHLCACAPAEYAGEVWP